MSQQSSPVTTYLVVMGVLGSWALAGAGDPGGAPPEQTAIHATADDGADDHRLAEVMTPMASPARSVSDRSPADSAAALHTPTVAPLAWATHAEIPMGLGVAPLAPARLAITLAMGARDPGAHVSICRLGADDPGARADPLGCTWLSVAAGDTADTDLGARVWGVAWVPPGDYGALRVRATAEAGAPAVTLPLHRTLAAGERVELRLGAAEAGPTLAYVGVPESAAARAVGGSDDAPTVMPVELSEAMPEELSEALASIR